MRSFFVREHKTDASLMHVVEFAGFNGICIMWLIPEEVLAGEETIFQLKGFHPVEHHVVGLMPTRVAGFPEWPITMDPADAQHILDELSHLECVRKNTVHNVSHVRYCLRTTVDRLVKTHPHIVPTLLEEAARFAVHYDKIPLVGQWFNKARSIEQQYAIAIDEKRHVAMMKEFVGLGVVGLKELSQEATTAAKLMEPQVALEYFLASVPTLLCRVPCGN